MEKANRVSISVLSRILVHAVLIAGAAAVILPFIWMVLTSLKTSTESTQVPLSWFPEVFQWKNFSEVPQSLPFAQFYWNTVSTTIVKTVFNVLFNSMAAYAFARIFFPGRNLFFLLTLSVMMVPAQVFIIPQYLLMRDLGWLNSLKAITITGMFSAYGTFLLRQFFLTLPKELEEAAKIDGCNHFTIYWRIMLPLAKPGVVAISIITILWSWNDFQWPLIVNNSTDKMTLSVGLASLQGQYVTNYPMLMAGSLMAIWPMALIFILLQRYFIGGITFTGIK
jgi:multiple sugar transport system permease protein